MREALGQEKFDELADIILQNEDDAKKKLDVKSSICGNDDGDDMGMDFGSVSGSIAISESEIKLVEDKEPE